MLLTFLCYRCSSCSEIGLNGDGDGFLMDGRKTPSDRLTSKGETAKQLDELPDKLRQGNDVSLKSHMSLALSYSKQFM